MSTSRGAVYGTDAVRDEDAFDVAALDTWLRVGIDLPHGPAVGGLPEVWQFTNGASNLTYLLRYADASGTRDLVARRPPIGAKIASAHDMFREYDIQRRLRPFFGAVPDVVAYATTEESPIGAEVYVMEYVAGVNLRADSHLDPQTAERLGERVIDTLVDLHAVDVDAAGLGAYYRGSGYVRRQVEGWSRRWRAAVTPDSPDAEGIIGWLDRNQPDDVGAALIHGDWRMDNMVLGADDVTRVLAVLDWEMATVGDPLMDLGNTMCYWIQADDDPAFRLFQKQPTTAPGMPTREEAVRRYLARSGLTLPAVGWEFYEVYGLFRLAVILQQIWSRFSGGQTSNPAFAQFGDIVRILLQRCTIRVA
jgi:aminoglycoside phosphotransferase (APT) family kinase protein